MAKKRVVAFKYTPSPEEVKARSICNSHNLTIYPVPMNNFGSVYKLHIYGDGYDKMGSEEYDATKDVWYRAIYKLYVKLKEKENYE